MQCLSSQNNGIEISTGEHADQIGWQFSVCFCRFFFFCFGSILFLSQTLQKLQKLRCSVINIGCINGIGIQIKRKTVV